MWFFVIFFDLKNVDSYQTLLIHIQLDVVGCMLLGRHARRARSRRSTVGQTKKYPVPVWKFQSVSVHRRHRARLEEQNGRPLAGFVLNPFKLIPFDLLNLFTEWICYSLVHYFFKQSPCIRVVQPGESNSLIIYLLIICYLFSVPWIHWMVLFS